MKVGYILHSFEDFERILAMENKLLLAERLQKGYLPQTTNPEPRIIRIYMNFELALPRMVAIILK